MLEAAGVTDILTKVLGTHNPHNVIKATMEGLRSLKSPEDMAKRRSLPVDQVVA